MSIPAENVSPFAAIRLLLPRHSHLILLLILEVQTIVHRLRHFFSQDDLAKQSQYCLLLLKIFFIHTYLTSILLK